MTKYRVTVMHDACTVHDVEADDDGGAVEAAMGEAGVSLCHYCTNHIELGDPIRAVMVENLETGASNDDADPDWQVKQLRARVAALELELKAAKEGGAA